MSFKNWRLLQVVLLSIFFLTQGGISFAKSRHFPRGTHTIFISKSSNIRAEVLAKIAPLIQHSITDGEYPGAVIYAGHNGTLIYRGIFGHRAMAPNRELMTEDTIFDLASLTKVVATTPAIMQLLETKQLDLDAPAGKYWPKFKQNGKAAITLHELLTHTSGLSSNFSSADTMHDDCKKKSRKQMLTCTTLIDCKKFLEQSVKQNNGILQKIERTKPVWRPGQHLEYSNLNFITLAYLLERVTGEQFADYVEKHIFIPLHMQHTRFLPPKNWLAKIAPTDTKHGVIIRGWVHDPMTQQLDGVSGAAGVFSTAADLGLYAETLLQHGHIPQTNPAVKNAPDYLLSPLSIKQMTTVQTQPFLPTRGLGWDLAWIYTNRGLFLPQGSYAHTGFTGTFLWIDPKTHTWIVFLTSRLHPSGKKHSALKIDRQRIVKLVTASLLDKPQTK